MDIKIKYSLSSVRLPFLNGSEEFKENESFLKREDGASSAANDVHYKFLNIPESLLDVINTQELKFKGDSKNLYLTTNQETFQVKQNFHSNCVLLMKPIYIGSNEYSAYTTQNSELELIPTKLPLDVSGIPAYTYEEDMQDEKEEGIISKFITKADFLDGLPMSKKEFEEQWKGALVIELGDYSIKRISHSIEAEILTLILVSVVSLNMEYTELDYEAVVSKVKTLKTNEKNIDLLVDAVFEKYTDNNKSLKMKDIAIFYGLKTLKRKCPLVKRKFIDVNDFYMDWKESLPSYFNCDLDIDFLVGHFVTDLSMEKIMEIDPKRLPTTIQERTAYLMNIQKTWTQKQIQPFFEELNENKIKPDNFIMKFARRKKGKNGNYIVTER